MKCHNCNEETEIREWEFWPYGKNKSEIIYTGHWCSCCHCYTTVREEQE